MMNKISEEFYTVVLDSSGHDQFVLQLILDQFHNAGLGRIIFCTLKGTTQGLSSVFENMITKFYSKNSSELLDRVVVKVPKSKEVSHIIEIAQQADVEDVFILFGSERLFNKYNGEGIVNKEFEDLKLRIYTEEDIPWNEVGENLLLISNVVPTGSKFIAIISVDERLHEHITTVLQDKGDPEIACLAIHGDQQLRDIQHEILKTTEPKELHTLLERLEKNKDSIPDSLFLFLRAEIYIKLGLRTDALNILKNIYGFINDSDKLTMAELFISQNAISESVVILNEIYQRDPLVPGLIRALIRASKKNNDNNELEKWLGIGEQIESDKEYIFHEAANYYNKIDNFQKSSEYYRKLCSLTHDTYYELMARVCDIQASPPLNGQDAENYILAVSLEHLEIQQEAFYRIGLIWWHLYNSAFKSYEFLSKINADYDNIIKVTEYKFMLLQDPIFSSQALGKLKPFEKSKDAQTLARTIVTELLKGLEPLSSKENGYIYWQDFIDKAQNEMIWKRYLSVELVNQCKKWITGDLSGFYYSSYIINIFKENEKRDRLELEVQTAIEMLQRIKTGELGPYSIDKIKDLIDGSLVISEKEGTTLDKLWTKYESSFIYSIYGENQEAINLAISIFYIGNKLTDPLLSKQSKALGFAAWANTQFRIGRVVEGLSCAIVAINLAFELKDLIIIQDCLLLVYKWVTNFDNLFKADEKQILSEFTEKVSLEYGSDKKLVKIESAILNSDWGTSYNLLKPLVIGDNIPHDSDWAGHFTNLISSCLNSEKEEEAFDLVISMSSEAVELLEVRKDIRAKAILMFVQVIIGQFEKSEDLLIAKELIKIAVNDIEKNRGSLFHATERSALSEMHQDIFKAKLEIDTLIFMDVSISEMDKTKAFDDIIDTFAFVTPRTIIEKRTYNNGVTPELIELESKYKYFLDELARIEKSADVGAYRVAIEEFNNIKHELTQKHPHYAQLDIYQTVSMHELQKCLDMDELFYQYVLTGIGITYLVVTSEAIHIGLVPTLITDLKSKSKALGETLTNYEGRGDRDQEVEQLCESISNLIYKPMLHYLQEYNIKNLYICPDMSMPFFSSALIRENNTWLVNDLNKICNVIDRSEIINKRVGKRTEFTNKFMVTIGAPSQVKNDAIHLAKKWIKEKESKMLQIVEDYSRLMSESSVQKPKVILIIAHGIPHPNTGDMSGANILQGINKETIWADDLKDICDHCETIVTFSCRSGLPFINQVETSQGIWANILSKNSNAVLCKWDVDIRPCLELLNLLLCEAEQHGNFNIPEILIECQRTLISSQKWSHPSFWAGLEYWGV